MRAIRVIREIGWIFQVSFIRQNRKKFFNTHVNRKSQNP
jgi:hypothetical protein